MRICKIVPIFAIPIRYGTMAEWLGNGLQNRVQQFDSAWYLRTEQAASHCGFFCSEVPASLTVRLFVTHTQPSPGRGPSRSAPSPSACKLLRLFRWGGHLGLVGKSRIKSLQGIDFNIFAKIITDMVKKMLFLRVSQCGQERPERQETTI